MWSNDTVCYFNGKINKDRLYVPVNYSVETKLRWLEGILDADGVVKNKNRLELTSEHECLLKDIQSLLSTLSIESNVSEYTLSIEYSGISTLQELGIKPNRLRI